MSDNIDIVVRDSGVEVVVRDLRSIGSTATDSQRGVDLLNGALKALGGALAIDKLTQWADAWNTVAGLVRTATRNQAEANAVTEELYKVAQKTRQPLTEIGTLYNRASLASSNLGASQAQLIQFTKGVGEALTIQHTTAQQASGSLLQLGQLLGMNKIRAQEYNSLLQNGVVILKTVAENLKGTGGTVAGLTAMVKGGKVPVRDFFQAFLAGSDSLEASFDKTSFLFSQAWTVITNGVEKYLGELDKSLGASKAFAAFAQFFVDHLPQIAAGFVAVGVAIAVAFAPAAIEAFLGSLLKISVWIYTNPFAVLIGAIAALVSYFYLYGDSINAGIDQTTSLKDVGRALVEELQGAWQGLLTVVNSVWNDISDVVSSAMSNQTQSVGNGVGAMNNAYVDFFQTNRTGWAAAFTLIARTVDAIAGLLIGIGHSIVNVFTGMPAVFENIFAQVYNAVVGKIEDIVNSTINGVNRLRKLVGTQLIDTVQFERKKVDADSWKKYGQGIANGIDQGFEDQGGFMEKWVDGLLSRAQQIGKARVANQGNGVDLNGKPAAQPIVDSAANAKAQRELEKLKKSLANVIGEISPAYNAEKHLAEAQDVLTKAVQKHLITQAQADVYMQKLTRRYRDQLDPIGAVTRKLQDEADTYKYVGDAQQAHQKLTEITQGLEQKGVDLTQKQSDALLKQIEAVQELNRVNQAQNSILQSTVYQRRSYIESLDAIAALQKNKQITPGQGAQAVVNSFGTDMMANTGEQMKAYEQSWTDMYARIDEARQKDLISEQTAAALKLQADVTYNSQRLGSTQSFLTTIASMQGTHSKKAAKIAQAAAIANATIDTYKAATGAYAAMASIPYVGPFLGAAAAAAAVVAGIANVSKIRSTNFVGYRTGGEFEVGGSGGIDSQLVAFRASPGEKVSVNTPSQARALERLGEQRPQESHFTQNVTLVVAGKPDRTTQYQQARALRRETMKEYDRSRK